MSVIFEANVAVELYVCSYLAVPSSRLVFKKSLDSAERCRQTRLGGADDRRDELIEWETHSSFANAHLLQKLADDRQQFSAASEPD